jgi:hypothetical protein
MPRDPSKEPEPSQRQALRSLSVAKAGFFRGLLSSIALAHSHCL